MTIFALLLYLISLVMQYACFDKSVDIEAWKNIQVNSTIANHTLCSENNVHKILIIYLLTYA